MEKKIDYKINLHYFKVEEFNQPGKPESWKNMDLNLLVILDNMRHRSKIPYVITSAYRDKEYNRKKGGVENSAHTYGKAVDIRAKTSKEKYIIIEAALHFGIQRIGVGSDFIHIDIQEEPDKPTKVIWTY